MAWASDCGNAPVSGLVFLLRARRTSCVCVPSNWESTLSARALKISLPAAQQIIEQQHLQPEQVCYIGDDLTDLPVMRRLGLGVAVADAAPEVRAYAHLVTQLGGGQGAVRELIETLLKAKNRWDDLIRKYLEQ